MPPPPRQSASHATGKFKVILQKKKGQRFRLKEKVGIINNRQTNEHNEFCICLICSYESLHKISLQQKNAFYKVIRLKFCKNLIFCFLSCPLEIIQHVSVLMSVCSSLLKGAITFDTVDRFEQNFQASWHTNQEIN